MKKIELIKKYIKVNEIGKAQDLIFRSINDSDIDIQGRTELIDLFVKLIPDNQSSLIKEMEVLLDGKDQILTYFSNKIKELPSREDASINVENIGYVEKIFLNLDLEKNTKEYKVKNLLDENYYGRLKDMYMRNINKLYFSSSGREKISIAIEKIFTLLSKRIDNLDAENNIYVYFMDEVMRDIELLIKYYAFDKVDYFIESIINCYKENYFPYKWEGKYPDGHIKYLTQKLVIRISYKASIPNERQAQCRHFSDDLEDETGFVWVGSQLLQDIHQDGRYTYIYINPDSYEPLEQVRDWTPEDGEGVQQAHYFHCDKIGIPREMTDDKGDLVRGLLWMGNKCVLILQVNRYVKFN